MAKKKFDLDRNLQLFRKLYFKHNKSTAKAYYEYIKLTGIKNKATNRFVRLSNN